MKKTFNFDKILINAQIYKNLFTSKYKLIIIYNCFFNRISGIYVDYFLLVFICWKTDFKSAAFI